MRIYKRFGLIFLALIFLSGCASQGTYLRPYKDMMRFGGLSYVSLDEFCTFYRIHYDVDRVSHVAEFYINGHTVKIMPESGICLVDGSVKRFSPQIRISRDKVYLPPSFIKFVEKEILKKEIPPPYIEKIILKKIVIDPGHGGKDPGAVGRNYKLREKDIVLDIAKRVRSELVKKSDIEVILTRDSDKFISLWRRSDMANKLKADLFVSIHANASRSRVPKGFEAYYLSEATDDSARARAAAENEALSFENDSSAKANNSAQWEMKLGENRKESKELAKILCDSVKNDAYAKDRGVKSARFYVLKGTLMPSVLIEVGFISNKEEEWKLRNSSYRQKMAESIARGILAYKDKYEKTHGFTKNFY